MVPVFIGTAIGFSIGMWGSYSDHKKGIGICYPVKHGFLTCESSWGFSFVLGIFGAGIGLLFT